MNGLSHLDPSGHPRMVDVSEKPITSRKATARAAVTCDPQTLKQVGENSTPKGAVIATAELAGIMGAKRTSELIPLCHPLPLTKVAVQIHIDEMLPGFIVESEARTKAETGVEMEALTAVSIAALTLFDMLKAVDRSISISRIELTSKSGGKSGSWTR